MSTISHQIRVIYGDTDQMGVVYYANYLRYFEAGRGAWCRAMRAPYRELEADGFFLPVVEAQLKYHRPAHYDDLLRVETRVSEVGRSRVRFEYRIVREDDGCVLCTGHTVHACLHRTGRLARLPDALRTVLRAGAEVPSEGDEANEEDA
ncbi:MAG: acyl-CoA thioesterase [Deltaproteobacteria bacterium]|nr:MAG: acyl-CoA thioesterase [Deltaproteobacteria bacterium]